MEYSWYIISTIFVIIAGILIHKKIYILGIASILSSIMCMIELIYYKKLLLERGG